MNTYLRSIIFAAVGFGVNLVSAQVVMSLPAKSNWVPNKQVSKQIKNAQAPDDYIISKFKDYDFIMLGEDHGVKNNLELVINIIPKLYQAGITNIAMEFGAQEMQAKLDSLLSAPKYDEQLARDMMYFYNVGWAYKEYPAIYKAVWEFNKTLPTDAKKFRVVNLSYYYDWGKFTNPRTPEVMSKVFYKGPISVFRKDIIENEILKKNEKGLALMGGVHTFSRYRFRTPDYKMDLFDTSSDLTTGNKLYRDYPSRIFNIMLHSPFTDKNHKGDFISPADGEIEAYMMLNGNKPIGFDLVNSPAGKLRDNNCFSIGYENFTMGDLYDGYIFLAPLSQLEGCSIDKDFFKGHPWSETEKQLPDPDWHRPANQEEYWSQIIKFVNLRDRYGKVINPISK